MKRLTLVLFAAVAAYAQAPNDFVGAGVSWNQHASPQISGVAVYAHKITGNEHPTYSFTALDVLSAKTRPFTVATVTTTGIAQHVRTIGPFGVYGLAMAGASFAPVADGTTVGLAFSGGGIAQASLGKGWTAGPYLRIIQSPGTERQWAVGLLLGWGSK